MATIEALEKLRGYVTTLEEGHGTHIALQASDLTTCADAIQQEVDERFVELPKDANGEVIRVGDLIDCGEHFGVREVEGFIHGAVAFHVYKPQPAKICTCPARNCRHYHEPTVEDMLRDFVRLVFDDDDE